MPLLRLFIQQPLAIFRLTLPLLLAGLLAPMAVADDGVAAALREAGITNDTTDVGDGATCKDNLSEADAATIAEVARQVRAKKIFPGVPELVKFDKATRKIHGLTSDGVGAVETGRRILAANKLLFGQDILNMQTMLQAGRVARLAKFHMFLYGPPGGAKSMFINWLMANELDNPFSLQLHQMITEQAFTGGQNMDAAKRGEFLINAKGSMADYVVALIDETDKGNPAALAALLGLMNERKVFAGGKTIDARLESLFATSNATLPEIFEQFRKNNMGTTAPALLNRFQLKGLVYNWLGKEDAYIVDQRRHERRVLRSFMDDHPSLAEDLVFQKPEKVNWEPLRKLAQNLFRFSPLYMSAAKELADDMRDRTVKAIRASGEAKRKDPDKEIYFPSADLSERLRQQIDDVVMMSAFLDFMESPMSSPENLAAMTEHEIVLGPESLWRAYMVFTTIGPGETKFKITPQADGSKSYDIDFAWKMDPKAARDEREEQMIVNLDQERDRFKSAFTTRLDNVKEHMQIAASNAFRRNGQASESFEVTLARLKGN